MTKSTPAPDAVRLVPEDHTVIKRCAERQPKLYMRGQHEGYYIHSDIADLIDIIGRLAAAPAPATARGGDALEAENVRLKAALDAAIAADDVLARAVWAEGELDRIVGFAADKGVTIPRDQAASTAIVNLMKLIEAQGAALASPPQATGGAVDEDISVLAAYAKRLGDRSPFAGAINRILAALATQPAPSPGGEPHVFLDCDGVLADFDTYAHDYFGMNPREYEKRVGSKQFWQELEAKGDFYRNLPLMPDAMALYEGVKHLNPTILTGCPRGNWAEAQKVAWAHEHFPGVPVITCRSADKRTHAKAGDVLIDDWPQHRHRWIEHGGVFITHHDAETSLAALWAHYPDLDRTQQKDKA